MKQKTRIIIYIAVAVAIVIIAVIAILLSRTGSTSVPNHLDLGRSYLLDLSYDKAILEFKEAIKIDPKNPEPYIELAKAYVEIDDIPSAIETLEDGFNETGDEEIERMLNELKALSDDTSVDDDSDDNSSSSTQTTASSETNTTSETTISEEAEGTEVNMVEVPDLSGLSEEEAKKLCEDSGFKYSISYSDSNEIEQGFVISQTIPAGTMVAEGISIPFAVSEGRKLPYTVDLLATYSKELDDSNLNFKTNYDKISDKFDFDVPNKYYDITYPYICRHGTESGEARVNIGDDPYYDTNYAGEMYYSIETGSSSINLSPRYYYVAQFSDGMAFFQRDYKKENKQTSCVRGYINTRGEEIFSYTYVDDSIVGSNGAGGNSWLFEDSSVVSGYNLYDMHYGYAAYAENNDGKYGIVDKNGNVLIKPKYESVISSSDGIIRVGIPNNDTYGEKYGYVDTNDNIIAKCEYDVAGEFKHGLAVVGIAEESYGKYSKGVINKNGQLIIPCQYDYILIDENGVITAFDAEDQNYSFYCFDKSGKQILKDKYIYICTGTNTGCPNTYGNANERILAQSSDGKVYMYDLYGNLICSINGNITHELMLFGAGGSGPYVELFDPTGIIYLGNDVYMDKEGKTYTEHPYGITVIEERNNEAYWEYISVKKVDGYNDVYLFWRGYDNDHYYYYQIKEQ